MEAAARTMKARILEREAATKKMKVISLDIEAARKKTADIFSLTVDDILYIFRFLRIEDRIAFALSCQRFRQLCMDEGVFRKLDLSRCAISTTQRCAVNSFLRDRRLTQHVRELNISNLRFLNWQMDDRLEEFILSICPQLEALHVIDCGVSFRRLCQILKQAPQLTALSWSIWDFTSEDIQFLLNTMKSPEGISLKNIKQLHLHVIHSLPQIEIAEYLVLSCCRDLEELEIYSWGIFEDYFTGRSFPLGKYESIPGFCQPSVHNELKHLHSLVVVPMGVIRYTKELRDFVASVLSIRTSSTKWKKFCIVPEIDSLSLEESSHLLRNVHQDDFLSVEAFGVYASESLHAVDEMKTLFESIADNTVRRLQLCLPDDSDSVVEFCNLISRVGGHSLKFLSLSFDVYDYDVHTEQNAFIHTLFSNCLNITELDLIDCSFERDICSLLSQLKHLTKVQLKECAITSKYSNENRVEISKADLLCFVENCMKITHLHIRYCYHKFISSQLTDDDLLALAKLRNLESFTLWITDGIREWTSLKKISENCKFLTTLRIKDIRKHHFKTYHIPMLMESVKFLKHLAIEVDMPVFTSEDFWNLLRHAKNLERLCITSLEKGLLNVAVAVETIKSLPRLHVLHLHTFDKVKNVDDFYDQLMRMLEEKESDCRFSFEVVTRNRRNTWINHPTGYSLLSNKTLPLNESELCYMKRILSIPRF